jgi:hypothetical protein
VFPVIGFSAILHSDLAEDSESGTVINAERIVVQVLLQKLDPKRPRGIRMPECGVQLTVSKERGVMKIARADCGPHIVNDYEFGMDPNGFAPSVVPQASNAGQRERFESF